MFDLHVNWETEQAGGARRGRGPCGPCGPWRFGPLRRTGRAPSRGAFLFSGRTSSSRLAPLAAYRSPPASPWSGRAGGSSLATPAAARPVARVRQPTRRPPRTRTPRGQRPSRRVSDARDAGPRVATREGPLAPIEPSSTRGTRTPRAMPACATCRCTRCARRDASRPCVSVVRAPSSDRFNVAGRSAAGAPGEDDSERTSEP